MSSSASAAVASERDRDRLHDDLQAEYFRLVDLVREYDQRLLTIKGWGVTLSLASLGLGFQQDHYGLFLVAAVSGLAFWIVEATAKGHQMRYYPRMRDIEVIAHELFSVSTKNGPTSSPLIDWGWSNAKPRLWRVRSVVSRRNPREPEPYPVVRETAHMPPWLFPHVMLPHIIAVLTGTILFVLGLVGVFGRI